MIIVNSKYEIATDELNNQIGEINDIVKSKNLKVYKSQATRTAEKVIGRKIVAK